MKELDLLLRGVLAGLAIAIPVGPVNVLCISRTIAGGRRGGLIFGLRGATAGTVSRAIARARRAGFISGLGAATADTFYGAIAGFSISLIINFLVREKFWIRLVGGALLIAIGLLYWFKKPQSLEAKQKESTHSAYVTTLLLTLT